MYIRQHKILRACKGGAQRREMLMENFHGVVLKHDEAFVFEKSDKKVEKVFHAL